MAWRKTARLLDDHLCRRRPRCGLVWNGIGFVEAQSIMAWRFGTYLVDVERHLATRKLQLSRAAKRAFRFGISGWPFRANEPVCLYFHCGYLDVVVGDGSWKHWCWRRLPSRTSFSAASQSQRIAKSRGVSRSLLLGTFIKYVLDEWIRFHELPPGNVFFTCVPFFCCLLSGGSAQ